jgi:uncharacterized protein with HEPN domain
VQGVTHEEYDADSTLQFAVAFLVLIVGEAASRLTDTARAGLSAVPWREIIGMRNRLIHTYGGIDFEIVWTTVREQIPDLVTTVRNKLEDSTPPAPPSA